MKGIYGILILLAGYLSPEWTAIETPEQQTRVVTQIIVEESDTEGNRLLIYEKPEQMSALLNWLRLMELRDPVGIDPDTFRSGNFRITLELSDGTNARYRQLHREFIQKNDGPWRPMIPGDGLQFPPK